MAEKAEPRQGSCLCLTHENVAHLRGGVQAARICAARELDYVDLFIMNFAKCLFVLAAFLLPAGMVGAAPTQITWQSPTGRMNILSDSQPWGSDFQLELGAFKSGFTPTSTNTDQWATNWVAVSRANYDASDRVFGGDYTFTNNNGPITKGAKAYIWGFGGSEIAGQWILLQKTNGTPWVWPDPAAGPAPLPKLWSTGSSEALLGTVNTNTNAPFHLQTAAVTNSAPPPTTWAQWAENQLGQTNHGNPDYNGNGVTDIWEYALHADGSGRDPDPASWLQQAEADVASLGVLPQPYKASR